MARLGKRVANQKRIKMVAKFRVKREELRTRSVDMKLTEEERFAARTGLNKLPKNSAPARIRNRCKLTGRSRGFIGKFGLCRNEFRRLANFGQIPGVTKSSW
ncbi:MAG: 30S ribosomal protein S14 [Bdellovibrionota bacterium]